jgi:hypothetical protein
MFHNVTHPLCRPESALRVAAAPGRRDRSYGDRISGPRAHCRLLGRTVPGRWDRSDEDRRCSIGRALRAGRVCRSAPRRSRRPDSVARAHARGNANPSARQSPGKCCDRSTRTRNCLAPVAFKISRS